MLLDENESDFAKRINDLDVAVNVIKSAYLNQNAPSCINYVLDLLISIKSMRLVWARYLSEQDKNQFYDMLSVIVDSIKQYADFAKNICRDNSTCLKNIEYVCSKAMELEKSLEKLNSKSSSNQFCIF